MTSPLDQVSFKLGTVDANIAILVQRADKHEKALSAQTALLDEIKAKLTPVVDDVTEMKPHVDHYAGMRKKAGWVHSVIVGVASICGGAATTYALKKFGG